MTTMPPKARQAPRAFTLVEVLACMLIFAIGFAAVAVILPTGLWMQRAIEDDTEATIVAHNALDIMKAKGLNNLTFLFAKNGRAMDLDDVGFLGAKVSTAFKTAFANNQPVYTPTWTGFAGAGLGWGAKASNWDMEGAAYCWAINNNTRASTGGANVVSIASKFTGMPSLHPYLNTDNNGWLWSGGSGDVSCRLSFINTYTSGSYLSDQGDLTRLDLGKIHYFKNRPVPGFTPGYPSGLDMSYPSSVLDLKGRSHVARVLCWNKSDQYEPAWDKAAQSAIPGNQNWSVAAMAMRMRSGDEWPELGNDNVALNGYLFANNTYAMRSVGRPPTAFTGGSWYRWFMASYPSHNTTAYAFPPSPTGGDPANTNANLRAGSLGMASQNSSTSGTDPVGRSWFGPMGAAVNFPYYGPLPLSVVGQPDRDPAFTTADYQGYVVPSLLRPYALVYDYNQDLILLRYPKVFAKVNTGDARVNDFWSRYPNFNPVANVNNWVDRKLKVGDPFLGSPGGYAFKVKAIIDPIAAGLAAPDQVDWSDGTYQVVRVTPSLKSTNYTPNKPCILAETINTEKTDPPLYQAVVGVPPIGGGDNPARALVSLPNANQTVFRSNADVAN